MKYSEEDDPNLNGSNGLMDNEKTTLQHVISNNRIILCVLFGISGLIFFILLMDSHFKAIDKNNKLKIQITDKSNEMYKKLNEIIKNLKNLNINK
jgi:hypothetical protein